MIEQQLIEIDAVQIDGHRLSCRRATIVIDLGPATPARWYATLLHPLIGELGLGPGEATMVAQTSAGERLQGRVRIADGAGGAGGVLLSGIGALQQEPLPGSQATAAGDRA